MGPLLVKNHLLLTRLAGTAGHGSGVGHRLSLSAYCLLEIETCRQEERAREQFPSMRFCKQGIQCFPLPSATGDDTHGSTYSRVRLELCLT